MAQTEYQDIYTANLKIKELERSLTQARESLKISQRALLELHGKFDSAMDALSRKIVGDKDDHNGSNRIKLGDEPEKKKVHAKTQEKEPGKHAN